MVASLCGFVVAVVSGATGVIAHWLAMPAPMPVTLDAVVGTVAACAGVGLLTTAGVGRFHPALVVPAGLVAAQGAVHHALDWSHRLHGSGHGAGHGSGSHSVTGTMSGHAAHLLHTPAERAAMTRAAMTAGADMMSHGEMMTHGAPGWPMLTAHAIATLVTAGALALVVNVLGWLAANVEQLVLGRIPAADRARTTPPERRPRASAGRFLLSRGLVRGPPTPHVVRGLPGHARFLPDRQGGRAVDVPSPVSAPA